MQTVFWVSYQDRFPRFRPPRQTPLPDLAARLARPAAEDQTQGTKAKKQQRVTVAPAAIRLPRPQRRPPTSHSSVLPAHRPGRIINLATSGQLDDAMKVENLPCESLGAR